MYLFISFTLQDISLICEGGIKVFFARLLQTYLGIMAVSLWP